MKCIKSRSLKFNPRLWQRLRQLTQLAALALFFYLFVYTAFFGRNWADLFYRFDPLIALTTTLAGRAFVPGLSLAGITLALTLLFGRVWCGWVCPLGTVLDWLRPRKSRPRRQATAGRWRALKYVLLATLVFAALLGNQSLLWLDPLTIMTRTLGVALWPALRYTVHEGEAFLYRYQSLWDTLDKLHTGLVYPVFHDVESVFVLALPVLAFFVGIVALNWWVERFWCRYVCPLGGLLGLVSKLALRRRDVGQSCAACALCGHDCPTGTIDPRRGYRSDPSECIVCYDCIVDCRREGVAFRWQLPRWRPAEWRDYDLGRREALLGLGAAAIGLALSGVETINKRQPAAWLRPPGARLTDFESLCVRCGECVRVCPTQGLQPSLFEGGVQNLLTPRLMPRLGHCDYNCNACGQVCPTGAIPPLALEQKRHTPIGLARIDRDRCLPWAYRIPCIVCEEACPLAHKAIWIKETEAQDTFGDTIMLHLPYMVQELCIGCGICEQQCPMGGEAAIRVFAYTDTGLYLGDDPNYEPPHEQESEG